MLRYGRFAVALMFAFPTMTLPAQGLPDDLTERPELWTCGAEDCAILAHMFPVDIEDAEGDHALALNYASYHEHYLVYPKYRDADWDLTSYESVEVMVRSPGPDDYSRGPNPRLYLRDRNGAFFRIRPKERDSLIAGETSNGWHRVRFPLRATEGWDVFEWLEPSLRHVDFIEVAFVGGGQANGQAHNVLLDGVRFVPRNPAYEPPDEGAADLDVLWIERTPRYTRYDVTRYDVSPLDPNVRFGVCSNADAKHQPAPGETVTFTAHVQNKGRQPMGGEYAWSVDGVEIARGTVPELAARGKVTYSCDWPWDPADHDLTFTIAPDSADFCQRNNALTIRTNALILKHLVERGAVAQMERRINRFGSRSAEDYLQSQIEFMNQLFAKSVYPFAPNGIEQRVMIGVIEYCDDGHLVTLGAGPYRVGEFDLSADGGRGVAALPDPWGSGGAMHEFLNHAGRPDGAWLHELSHQIGVIDDYQLITEPEDNLVNGVGYNYRNRGLMGGGDITPYENPEQLYSYYSPSNVMGLNVTKGKRRGYFGEYLYCLPRENVLMIVDETGDPVADAEIRLYQTNMRKIDDTPEHEGRTDANGRFAPANRAADAVTTETSCVQRDNPFGAINVVGMNGAMLVIIEKDGVEKYGFFTVPDLNLAWMSGHKDRAEIPVAVRVKGDERYFYGPPCPAM